MSYFDTHTGTQSGPLSAAAIEAAFAKLSEPQRRCGSKERPHQLAPIGLLVCMSCGMRLDQMNLA